MCFLHAKKDMTNFVDWLERTSYNPTGRKIVMSLNAREL